MDTGTPKRTWRKLDLAAIARDQPIRDQLHWLWLSEVAPLFACFLAGAVTFVAYVVLWSDQIVWSLGITLILFLPVGVANGLFLQIRRSSRYRREGAVTEIWPDPGPGRGIIVVVAIEVLLVVVTVFGGEPLDRSIPLLAAVLCVNTLLVTWIRLATTKRRARLLATPELSRILTENAEAVASSVHKTTQAPVVRAWSEAEQANVKQTPEAASSAWLSKLIWSIPAGIGFMLLSLIRAPSQLHLEKHFSGWSVGAALVVLGILGAVGGSIYDRADRRRRAAAAALDVQSSASAQYALTKDHRTPILLLRSFGDDAARNGTDRFEETIAPWLSRYGPVVAIGNPRDSLPDLGAYRDYVPEEKWQEHVREFMRSAAVIVMIPGKTPFVKWELGQILEGDYLHKTAFVFPPGLALSDKSARLEWTWNAFVGRSEFHPLQTTDLAETVVLHFFLPDAVTLVTDAAFAGASRYTYDKALSAAFSERRPQP